MAVTPLATPQCAGVRRHRATATAQEAMRVRTESAREVRMIGTRAPSTMPAASALARNVRFLASILPASRSGTTRICARPATSDLMPLMCAASGLDGVVESERAIEDAAGDLSAIGHLAKRGRLDGGWDLRGHGLDRGKDGDTRSAETDLREKIDRVLDDVALGIEVGEDVDRGIGDEQRLGIGGHIHDEDMADPARRAQAGLARGHLAHELVGVQAALHQQLALGFVDQLDRLCRGRLAVRGVDDLEAIDVDPVLAGHGGNLRGRTDQDRNDDAGFRRLDGAAQRGLVAGMQRRWSSPAAPSFALAISRSYFEVGGLPNGLLPRSSQSALSVSIEVILRLSRLVDVALMKLSPGRGVGEGTSARLGATSEPASTPNSRATSFIRFLSSAENSPRAPSTCSTSSNAASRVCLSGGSIDGMAASAAFWSISSMLNCSRTSALNIRQRHVAVRPANPAHRLEAALVDRGPRHADIEERADHGFAQSPGGNARLELGDPGSAAARDAAGSSAPCATDAVAAGSMPTAACSAGKP